METLQQAFQNAYHKGRLSHAYLFEGMKGVGKRPLALYVAQLLLCQEAEKPCGHCDVCRRIQEGNYPDVMEIYPDGTMIKVDQIRELKQQLSRTAMEGASQVCLIHEVDALTTGAANSLLKFLEEPDSAVVFILMTTHLGKVLPTIQSRCQIVRFAAPTTTLVTDQLVEQGVVAPVARLVAELTGDVDEAAALAAQEEFLTLRQESWQWFVRVFQKKNMAFVTVQSQLVPLLTSKAVIQQFLELMTINLRDALYMAMDLPEQVIQTDRRTTFTSIVGKLSVKKWVTLYEQWTHVQEKVQANVGIQAALEQWVLQVPL